MRACRAWGGVLAVLLVALPGRPAPQENGRIISVARQDLETARLGRLTLDALMEKEGRVHIIAGPAEIEALAARRIAYAFEPDRRPVLSADGGINGAYHTTLEMETDLRLLERDHPGLARVVEIGRSLEGRSLQALKISDNAAENESEAAVLVLGCHHAREWISVEVPYLVGRHLLESYDVDPEVRGLVDSAEIWIVPIVNPDGLEYSVHVYRYWRKNRRANADGTFGVDINRNYGYRWGTDDAGSSGVPASEVYRGQAPFSEPETAAVRDLCLGRDVRAVVSYHSYSQVILYPWGYTTAPAPREAELRTVAEALSGLMAGVSGTVYGFGQASSALYTTNGDTTDWTYSLAGAPSYTIELPPVDVDGGGFFNDESAIAAIFAENLPALLYLTRYAIDHPLPGRRTILRPTRTRSLPGRLDRALFFRLPSPDSR
jgi:murein tripeptide amidase MpaA